MKIKGLLGGAGLVLLLIGVGSVLSGAPQASLGLIPLVAGVAHLGIAFK